MEIAIAQAGISPREVRHLKAHATSTPVGDLGEIAAIKSLFERDFAIAVSATKSATGHLLGAAGGLGAIFAILALRDQVALPTLNLSAPDPTGDGIDFVANQARPMAMDYAVSMASASEESMPARCSDAGRTSRPGGALEALMTDAVRSGVWCFPHAHPTQRKR
jgi:3-oxoacyl-(acyl-carrier-protein) synthase